MAAHVCVMSSVISLFSLPLLFWRLACIVYRKATMCNRNRSVAIGV